MLTVEQLLSEVGLELASGQERAATAVRSVHSTELLDPTPWLRGGELLLTTGIQLDTDERQHQYVGRLVRHGIAGVGFGVGLGHQQLPVTLLAAAHEHGLPVFAVPYSCRSWRSPSAPSRISSASSTKPCAAAPRSRGAWSGSCSRNAGSTRSCASSRKRSAAARRCCGKRGGDRRQRPARDERLGGPDGGGRRRRRHNATAPARPRVARHRSRARPRPRPGWPASATSRWATSSG